MNVKYLITELSNRRKRTMISVLSLAVGVALFISLQVYIAGYQEAATAPLTEIGADIVFQNEGQIPSDFEGIVFPHSSGPIDESLIEHIRSMNGVESIAEALFFWSFEPDGFLVGLGVDPTNSVGPGRLRLGVSEGRFLEADDTGMVVVDSSYASQNQLKLNDQVMITGETFTIVGFVDTSKMGSVANANVYLTISDAQRLLENAPNVNNLYQVEHVRTNIIFIKADTLQAIQVVEEIEQMAGSGALVTTPRTFEQELGSTFEMISRFGLLIGFIGLVIALLSLIRTVSVALWERRKEIGLMRAVGWRMKDVTYQLTLETMTLILAGWFLGTMLAWFASWLLRFYEVTVPVPWDLSPTPHFLAGGAQEFALTVNLESSVDLMIALLTLGVTIVIGAMISLWISWKVANIKPAEVLKGE